MEDIRLKPASFDILDADGRASGDVRAQGTLKIDVRGRDARGRRQWLHGKANVEVRGSPGTWRLEAIELLHVEWMVSRDDLYSEVSAPAGLGNLSRRPKRFYV